NSSSHFPAGRAGPAAGKLVGPRVTFSWTFCRGPFSIHSGFGRTTTGPIFHQRARGNRTQTAGNTGRTSELLTGAKGVPAFLEMSGRTLWPDLGADWHAACKSILRPPHDSRRRKNRPAPGVRASHPHLSSPDDPGTPPGRTRQPPLLFPTHSHGRRLRRVR